MTELETTLSKNGFLYQQRIRNEHAAVYQQFEDGVHVAYEVGIVKKVETKEVFGKVIEAHEAFWGNEDFGKIAWTFHDRVRAFDQFRIATTRAIEQLKTKAK